jgi:hypothetical protein
MNNTIPTIIYSGKEWDEYGFSYIRLGTLPIDDDDYGKREKHGFL